MRETREQILAHLQLNPGLSAGDLAEQFDLSVGAVRHHLVILEKEALISSESKRQPIGRPCIVYELTEKGEESFPKQYDRLSSFMLDTIKEDQGSRGLRNFLRRVGDRIIEQSGISLQNDTGIDERARLLADIMDREGFSVEWKRVDNELHIIQHSCPYQSVVSNHQEVCKLDEHLIERVTGKPIKRLEHRSKGDCACVFSIQLDD
ncbi:MAG: winged helix-turn-helix transcriptional regulator [Anaerolineales bacterium]|jgi:predicted ArsR family transcriptional regulator